VTVGVLQLPSAHKRGVRVLLFSEYLLNSFFKELQHTPVSMLRELSEHQLKVLRDLASAYDMTFVAPLVTVKAGKPYKTIARISPRSTAYYQQQILIDYPHWNEEAYYANPVGPLHEPLTFRVDNVRFGIIGGYELHFDEMWRSIWEKRIDCILLPTSSTFDSQERWRELIKMRAFTHNCYDPQLLRAARQQDRGSARRQAYLAFLRRFAPGQPRRGDPQQPGRHRGAHGRADRPRARAGGTARLEIQRCDGETRWIS